MDTLRFFVFPGGVPPKKAHEEDIGCDLGIRAIVDVSSSGRKTLFDFEDVCDLDCDPKLFDCRKVFGENSHDLSYRLDPCESVSLGLGVVVEIPQSHAGYIEPRGSSVKKAGCFSRLEVANSRVPIDPGFRGEPWAELVNHGPEPFLLRKGMYLVQLVVRPVFLGELRYIPELMESLSDFSPSERSFGCNGSSG